MVENDGKNNSISTRNKIVECIEIGLKIFYVNTNVNSNNITVNKKDKDICKEPQSIMMKEKNLQYNQLNNFHQILMTTILSKGDLLVSET